MTTDRLHLQPKHRQILEELLQEHLPEVEVWAYGSRITGRSHDGSDLDLVLRGPELKKIPIESLTDFEEALRESPIPFLVEARDWARLPERFHREIERDYEVVVDAPMLGKPWHTKSLGECIVMNEDSYSSNEAWPFVNYLDTGNITENRISDIQHLIPGKDKLPSRARKKAKSGDILYSTVRPNQKHFGLLKDVPENFLASTGFAVFRGQKDMADTAFIYWFLTQDHIIEQLHTIAEHSTSAYPSIRPTDIKSLELPLPPLPEQRAIARIISKLDDKIELNRRMNDTLEEMARALYKSWFIDFDPVRAKMALKRHPNNNSPLEGEWARSARGGNSAATKPPKHDIQRAYSPKTLQRAKTLRRNQTDAEGLLWHYLRGKQLGGYKFRRQQPIGPYIADFACMPSKLLIELDGSGHAEQHSYDEQRDTYLRERGYQVLRVWNNDVFENCMGVLERIYLELVGPEDAGFSEKEAASAQQPAAAASPHGRYAPTPPQGGSNWSVERARAYLEYLGEDIADLFPNRMVDSELGEIPEGWAVECLSNHSEVAKGISYKGSELGIEGMPLHNLNSIREGGGYKYEGIKYFSGKYAEHHVLYPGDIIVANTEQGHNRLLIGYTAIVPRFFGHCGVASHHIYRIKSKPSSQLSPTFLSFLLNSPEMHDTVSGYANGTTVNMLPIDSLQKPMIACPPKSLVVAFDLFSKKVELRRETLETESRTLTTVLASLLPKLISGELQVRMGERIDEAL